MSKFRLCNPLSVKEVVSLSLLKPNNMRFLPAFALAFIISLPVYAQTTDQSFTVEQYVTEVLIGDGVNVSNITYSGGMDQLGYMSGAEGVFSVGAGLVLSTDNALNLTDPNCGANMCADCPGNGVDADLLDVANSVPPLIGQSFSVSSVNDLCILEFDFEAGGDSIAFNYVFGSDEYLEWVNSSYNDIFAFFLSGPGITGPYAAPDGFPDGAINIAQVPESDPLLPVTISSVNDVTNPMYYVDNFNNDGICIDGYTQAFTLTRHIYICWLPGLFLLILDLRSCTARRRIVATRVRDGRRGGGSWRRAEAQADVPQGCRFPQHCTISECRVGICRAFGARG